MIIIFACVALVVVGLVGLGYMESKHQWSEWPLGMVFLGLILLGVCAITIPIARMQDRAVIAEIRAVEATMNAARSGGIDPMELAAFQHKVAEANGWVAKRQYWRGTIFGIWYAPEVDEMELIK